jgi:putative oxidoreductase
VETAGLACAGEEFDAKQPMLHEGIALSAGSCYSDCSKNGLAVASYTNQRREEESPMRFLSSHEGRAYLLLRLVFGFLFACHGASKLFGVLGQPKIHPALDLAYLSGVIEFVAGVLIFIGLFTHVAAFIASGEMAVAYFMQHDHSQAAAQHGYASFFPLVNHGELAVIYCFVALYIATHGAGKLGLDRS